MVGGNSGVFARIDLHEYALQTYAWMKVNSLHVHTLIRVHFLKSNLRSDQMLHLKGIFVLHCIKDEHPIRMHSNQLLYIDIYNKCMYKYAFISK